MHDIEPYHRWLEEYESPKDKRSPFYGRVYNEMYYTQKIYNYFIHPLWDDFGSQTLYMKILYADYEREFAIFEMLGEWNDCLQNDVMYLKRDVVDELIAQGIRKFIIICDNVLNFHGSDDCYYEEWFDDIKDEGGWICLLNLFQHVEEEMRETHLNYYVNFGGALNDVNWRVLSPKGVFKLVEKLMVRSLQAGR
jgi:hypothetical protein